jgi:hypothetical protein
MKRLTPFVALALPLLSIACPGPAKAPEPPPPVAVAPPPLPEEPVIVRPSKSGLGFRVTEVDGTTGPARSRLAKGVPLSPEDEARLIARLPAMDADPNAVKEFALRDKSTPPPRTGKTVSDAFPPPISRPVPAVGQAGALKVTRHLPDGEVAAAPQLSISFNQPMVAVTSHGDLAGTSPVTLTPTPPGKWRWIGTQTLLFEPTGRFPMATQYRVDVPAGTRSVNGGALGEAVSWTFGTPPPKLTMHHPNGSSVELEPLMFLGFDQAMSPDQTLAALEVKANGRKVDVRLATEDEIESDPPTRNLAHRAEKGRFVVLKAKQALPRGTGISITVPTGTPSAEGPRRTDADQAYSFQTFGPMVAHGLRCNWSDDCPPLHPLTIEFSNAIVASKFDKSLIKVEPEIANLKIIAQGSSVTLSGRTKGRTKYRITVRPGVPDRFGQVSEAERVFEQTISSAEPMLFSEQRQMMVLDPAAKGSLPVFTVNEASVRVRLFAVRPEDWDGYIKWRRDWDYEGKRHDPPGTQLVSNVINVKGAPDELAETPIDLAHSLNGGVGQVIVLIEPTRPAKKNYPRESYRAWVQVTNLGVDAFADGDHTVGWVTDLATGAPLPGVQVSSFESGAPTGTTGDDGLANIPGLSTSHIVARRGTDIAALFAGHSPGASVDAIAWLVYDDRKTYRPAEDVHVKGFLRIRAGAKGADVRALSQGNRRVKWNVVDARGVELAKSQEASIDEQGGFDLQFSLPKTPNLGQARVHMKLVGDSSGAYVFDHDHRFSIEEFRRPEFEVSARAEGQPFEVGRSATVTVAAKYYAGGGLPEAPVTWRFESAPASFRPPNREAFSFGRARERSWFSFRTNPKKPLSSETLAGLTTGQGEHKVRVDFESLDEAFPLSISAEASVMDVSRQAWAARTSMLVHPSELYTGLRLERSFVRAGEAMKLGVVVTDRDGTLTPGKPVKIRAARLDWDQVAGEMKELEKDVVTCDVTSAITAGECALKTTEAGRYRVLATVVDRHGRPSQTELFVWVIGDGMAPDRSLARDAVTLVADRPEYTPGDTAEVLVVAPFAPAEGVVSVQRQGITHLARFTMKSRTETVKVPVGLGSFPGVTVRVDLVGSAPRESETGEPSDKLPPRPAFATSSTKLSVPPRARTIQVTATPRDAAIEPGGTTTVDVDLKDPSGKPVAGASVAVVVADEAVLALGPYELPDPIAAFYGSRDDGTSKYQNRSDVVLPHLDPNRANLRAKEKPAKNAPGGPSIRSGAGTGTGQGFGSGHGRLAGDHRPAPMASAAPPPAPKASMAKEDSADKKMAERDDDSVRSPDGSKTGKDKDSPIATRSNFDPLAAFAPAMISDGNGRASLSVKLPDSLTRYRIMAVVVSGERDFGAGESTLTARLPLMVRPSAPRFLSFGDTFELPVIVQNQTNAEMQVDVVARAQNASLPVGSGRRIAVPANDRVEVRLPAAAAKPGKAVFQVGIASGRFADAATVELPVWTPATTEAFATYGTIDEGAISQPIKMPSGVVTQFGGLEITTSSTQVAALTDAVLYLVRYPFDCNEQLASRVMSIAALRDVLTAFGSPSMPAPAVLLEGIKADMAKLRGRQHWNGGFSFWGGDREPWPYLSIHVMHALARAKDKGFPAPEDTINRGKSYLRNIESNIPSEYSIEARRALIAYALSVRRRLGDSDPGRARKLIAEAGGVEKIGMESLGWLLFTMTGDAGSQPEIEAIRKHLANRVSETAGAAHFVTAYDDGAHFLLSSDRRADGVILDALIGDQKDSDLIPKIVTGLLAHRKAGRWYNTNENAFVLLALDRYFNTYEKVTPDFVARAWLGDRYAGEHAFKGRTTERHQIDVPMKTVSEVGAADLVLQKDGAGRLYYRIGMQYAPSDLRPPPAEHGFTVTRAYEPIDAPDDVKRDAEGVWHVRAGSKVRVRLTMIAPSRRYHVALVDPLPAGLEPMNPALAVTGSIPQDDKKVQTGAPWWWSRSWYEHQNMRDERVEAFASLLWDGIYDYTYVARATTPGNFVAPPPKAEEMYSPETFGRGAGDRVIVE